MPQQADFKATPVHRSLRVARRLFGATAAAWVGLGADGETVTLGDLMVQEATALGVRIGRAGKAVAVADLSRAPSLRALKERFAYLLAVPVGSPDHPEGVLMVLGAEARSLSPRDAEVLADLGVVILAASQPAPREEHSDREQWAAAVQHMPLIVHLLDADGKITRSEGRGLEWLGLSPDEKIGSTALELFNGDEEAAMAVRAVLAGEASHFISEIGDRTLEHRLVPVVDATGGVSGAIVIAVDMTQRARIEADIVGAKQRAETACHEAEAANREQSSFLASMSHEIRTPLTGIIGFADILAEVAEGEARGYAEVIQKSGHRLLDTLNSVLNLARLDANQVSIRLADINLAEEAADAARLLRPLAEHKNLRLHLNAESITVTTDPSLVHRVITNLVANAIKFTDEGSVSLSVSPEEGGAVIDVVDTGRGMRADFLPLLFEPFRRENDDASQPEGTGLGLTITKRLVNLLGGTIDVESEFGQGSRFSVHLPGTASTVSDVAHPLDVRPVGWSVAEVEGDGASPWPPIP